MHHSGNKDEIVTQLAELGHNVKNINNILQRGTKKPHPLFTIELEVGASNKNIYKICCTAKCPWNRLIIKERYLNVQIAKNMVIPETSAINCQFALNVQTIIKRLTVRKCYRVLLLNVHFVKVIILKL